MSKILLIASISSNSGQNRDTHVYSTKNNNSNNTVHLPKIPQNTTSRPKKIAFTSLPIAKQRWSKKKRQQRKMPILRLTGEAQARGNGTRKTTTKIQHLYTNDTLPQQRGEQNADMTDSHVLFSNNHIIIKQRQMTRYEHKPF